MEVQMEDPPATDADTDAGGGEVAGAWDLKTEKPSPYDALKESKASVELIVAKMLSIKKGENPKSHLRELATEMFINFVTLRQVNRTILIEEDRLKAETERSKAPVDFTTLQLHNLMYEKNHYVKAIKACKDFKSKYPDIELVSEDEFFHDAPEGIRGNTMPNGDPHNLMLKRLNYELYQRKELCKLHKELEESKKKLSGTIANRKKFLSSLPSYLKSLRKASLPVQQQLGILHTKKLKQHNLAELLPPPLYIIYSQFMAQKEAFGENIDLEIIGSLKDAHAFARQQSNRDAGASTDQESLRVEDDVPEEDDDDQRRRKRPRKIPGKDNLDQAGIYEAHPLRIVLHIEDDDMSNTKPVKLVTLKFEYLLNMNVVCVGIEGGVDSSVLCNLFPDDAGLELPQQFAKLCFGDSVVFDKTRTSRPYKWAQHLAGLDFLPEVSPFLIEGETKSGENSRTAVMSGLQLYRQQNRTQTIVQRIRSRVKAQLALVEQLDQLMKLKWPSLTCESVPWFLHEPLCSLHNWSAVGSSSEVGTSLLGSNMVQGEESSHANLVDVSSDASKGFPEFVREDGELPTLLPALTVASDDNFPPKEGSDLDHSRSSALMSKTARSPFKVTKTLSFRRQDDDSELMMDSDSDLDESKFEPETERVADADTNDGNSWVDYRAQEFSLVLTRKMSENAEDVKLEAKVNISIEYPLRPPLWSLELRFPSSGETVGQNASSAWFNELRAMEAEVNLHILKMLSSDQQNYTLSHQVHYLAMLFDVYMTEVAEPFERRKSSSVVDVGLCKPTGGTILARSFRGRDRRKMLSWKDMECSPGYPY